MLLHILFLAKYYHIININFNINYVFLISNNPKTKAK